MYKEGMDILLAVHAASWAVLAALVFVHWPEAVEPGDLTERERRVLMDEISP